MSLLSDFFQFLKGVLIPSKRKRRKPIANNRRRKEHRSRVKVQKTTKNPVTSGKTSSPASQKKQRYSPSIQNRPKRIASAQKKKPFAKSVEKKKNQSARSKLSGRTVPVDTKSPLIGEVTHYFSKINVIVLRIDHAPIKLGDKINIKGKFTDFIQKTSSLQIESVDVKSAKKGQLVGLKVLKPVQAGDKVYKLS